MPFTPTHILAVTPLWRARRVLPFTALAIGAMVPDLPLFLPVVTYPKTHAPLGALTLCLPIGLTLLLVFERVMREPLTALLPRPVRARLPTKPAIPPSEDRPRQLAWLLGAGVAIVLGAWSHQFWDSFTHHGRWGVSQVPALAATYNVMGIQATGYKFFQHGSELIGLPLLAIWGALMLIRTPPSTDPVPAAGPLARRLVALLIVLTPCVVAGPAIAGNDALTRQLFQLVTQSCLIVAVGLLVYCLCARVGRRQRAS